MEKKAPYCKWLYITPLGTPQVEITEFLLFK